MTNDYDEGLRLIYREERGYVEDLKQMLSESIIDKFASVGFINYGYTIDHKTWSISKLGKVYCEDFIL